MIGSPVTSLSSSPYPCPYGPSAVATLAFLLFHKHPVHSLAWNTVSGTFVMGFTQIFISSERPSLITLSKLEPL